MKAAFNFFKWSRKKISSVFFAVFLPLAASAQQATYTSPAIVNSPPNVNATNFINTGVWNIVTPGFLPFQTFSTYNYTNSGTMNCLVGWEFDHGPYPTGTRGWSANFFNDTPGTISALDESVIYPSRLLISATNILNKGSLMAGPYGGVILHGSGINLTRSGLEITPISGDGSGNNKNNFSPDIAIYDEYWRGGTNDYIFFGSPWDGTAVSQALLDNVGAPCGVTGATVSIGPVVPQAVDSETNVFGQFTIITTNMDLTTTVTNVAYSNIVHQAIFAYASDANITPTVGFGSIGSSRIFRSMVAKLLTYSTNIVTGALQPATIYVFDDLAAVTNSGYLLQNTYFNPGAMCQNPTYRPDSVIVARSLNGNYNFGTNVPDANFFYNSSFSNSIVVGKADAYSAFVDNLAAEPPTGFSITNAPGRIEIYAKDLNLSKARISAASEILIQASNLVSSAGATMDCQNLSYNLGSTNGQLNVTNLAGQSVQRLSGTVSEWSGQWTNYMITVYPNFITNSAATNSPFYTESDITNVTEMDLAITVVDAGGLATVVPVNVLNLFLHSTNMVVSDTMNVESNLLFDGQSLTIQGGISITGSLEYWNASVAPTLRFFTNNGVLNVPNSAYFGNDGATNYLAFVNTGTITAGSETINSAFFQGGGSQTVSGTFAATTLSGKVENGSVVSGQNIQLYAGTLKLNNATLTAGGELFFQVTNSLFDAGSFSSNVLACGNGFDLAIKPATGDLLGTKITTTTPAYSYVDHYWSGNDLGAISAGYTNNEAVGQLVLNEGSGSEFVFHATGAQNAIYVDLLDLSQCPDFTNADVLTIDPNFVIYYAAVKLPSSFVVPPNATGIPQLPEEYLNGQLGGHLLWVNSFAGPNSSVAVLINGQTALVNKALRYSKIIDSNGNGIPNYYDLNPFDPPPVVLSASVVAGNPPPTGPFTISWTAAPSTIYLVQYSTNISPAVWVPLLSYTNVTSSNLVVTVQDTNAVSGQRFYRVSHP